MLELKNVESFYSQSQVLFGIDLQVNDGEVVTLLGRNGMGKTTTIHSIMGLVRARSGEINFEGNQVREWPSHLVAQAGIGLVPEGRQIFPNLNVIENLVATASNRLKNKNPWTLDRVFELFPRLPDRAQNMGNQLSGGEQQMLAIARGLMSIPKLLMVDEPFLGLSPKMIEKIKEIFKAIVSKGIAILFVEQNVKLALNMADRGYVLESGHLVIEGKSDYLLNSDKLKKVFLG